MNVPVLLRVAFASFAALFSIHLCGQSDIYWNAATAAPTSLGTNYTVADITQNNNNGTTAFVSSASASSGYSFTLNGATTSSSASENFALASRTGALNTGSNGSAFVEVAITPNASYKLTISAVNFASRSTSTGPQAYDVQYSVAGGAYISAKAGSLSNNSTWGYFTNLVSIAGTVGQAITLRIYGYNGTGTPANNTANWRLDDIVITTTAALPVTFGAVAASNHGDNLTVKWTTVAETNNDYFEVQASKDGKDFKAIKTIRSQNGNSDVAQHYELTVSVTDMATLFGIPIILALLSFGMSSKRRVAISMLALIIFLVNLAACSKQDALGTSPDAKIFIRIKQVDKDGGFKFSNVVQAIRQ